MGGSSKVAIFARGAVGENGGNVPVAMEDANNFDGLTLNTIEHNIRMNWH
jgi:hypothetical protein